MLIENSINFESFRDTHFSLNQPTFLTLVILGIPFMRAFHYLAIFIHLRAGIGDRAEG